MPQPQLRVMLEDCLPKAMPEGWKFLWRQKMWSEDVASFERFDGLSLTVCVVQRDGQSILDATVSVLKPNCLPTHTLMAEAVNAFFPQLKGKTLTVIGQEHRKKPRKIRHSLLRAEVELSADDVVRP